MKLWSLLFATMCAFSINATISAQEPFYKGKVVRIVTGASAGGGLDTYSRTIARHMREIYSGQSDYHRGEYARGWRFNHGEPSC